MSTKNKNKTQNLEQYAGSVAMHIGFAVMSMTAIVSLLELHEARVSKHLPGGHAALHGPTEAAVHTATHTMGHDHNRVEERMRREKEEIRHALVSYGVTMRSHPTAGPA